MEINNAALPIVASFGYVKSLSEDVTVTKFKTPFDSSENPEIFGIK